MTQNTLIDIMQLAIRTIILVAAPPLLMGLIVGLIVSIFQAVTSIQEPTLAFVPKILAVFFSILIFGPYMMTTLTEFITQLFNQIPSYITPLAQ